MATVSTRSTARTSCGRYHVTTTRRSVCSRNIGRDCDHRPNTIEIPNPRSSPDRRRVRLQQRRRARRINSTVAEAFASSSSIFLSSVLNTTSEAAALLSLMSAVHRHRPSVVNHPCLSVLVFPVRRRRSVSHWHHKATRSVDPGFYDVRACVRACLPTVTSSCPSVRLHPTVSSVDCIRQFSAAPPGEHCASLRRAKRSGMTEGVSSNLLTLCVGLVTDD